MGWTTYDISEITEALVTQLTDAMASSNIWAPHGPVPFFQVKVSACSPDDIRDSKDSENQLCLYLLHVGQDPFFRNTPIYGPSAMANNQQPLALNLSYLLTAYSPDNALREQQMMSVALAYFHEHPIYTGPPDATGAYQHFTVGLGPDSLSEMSALWQSFTVSYRLSTIYRVAIAFITPTEAPGTPKPKPVKMGLTLAPAAALAPSPQIFGALQQLTLTPPAGGDTNPEDVVITPAPILLQAGVQLLLGGQGFSTAPLVLRLSSADGSASVDITGWVTGTPTDTVITLIPPADYAIGAAAAPPASTPVPGIYLLSIGGPGPSLPIIIAPLFSGVTVPAVLNLSGGSYSFSGAGFVPGATQLFVAGVLLDAGVVSVDPAGTKVTFSLPNGTPAGTWPLRVRVEGVDAPATWQVAA